ncbi:MAG: DUF6457 domain-containing protein [Bifidobacteriaceae bacterium]|jgi:hypothetical protein|nr:DUF6457 domain-containing protein [Bifidobacteriaceae bacterium]
MRDTPDFADWLEAVAQALDCPDAATVDVGAVLDMTSDVAHLVARPAAPLTAFAAGYAAGLRGGGCAAARAALAACAAAAHAYPGPAK